MPFSTFSRTKNRIITHTPIEEGCTSTIVAKYKIRFLVIDYQTTDPFLPWRRFSSAERKRYWNIYFWNEYMLDGITVEKIFLIYTEQDQRSEAVEDAKAMYDHGKRGMEFYSRLVGTNGSSVTESYHKGIELRRRYGLGFNVPLVEAILDTELIRWPISSTSPHGISSHPAQQKQYASSFQPQRASTNKKMTYGHEGDFESNE
ncbi:hypothetical protein EAF04_003964 [Stromatinia cepivora]|nr:hypothetical protein EAF04_003964 [Stromatinia cepivora]